MRYIKSVLICVISALVFCLSHSSAQAADNFMEIDGFVFGIQQGNAVIHGYNGNREDVVIPDTLLYAPVTEIDNSAFYGCDSIRSVSFAEASHLVRLGNSAFYGCSGLQAVDLPGNITEIGFGAFQNCSELKRLVIGEGITVIPSQCFYQCSSLSEAYLPGSVTEIRSRAFDLCDNLVICTPSQGYAFQYALDHNIPVIPTDTECVLGDSNADGSVSINDVTLIQQYLAELETLEGTCHCAADANQDGTVDIADATAIQMYIAEYELVYPIGEIITQ